MQRETPAWRLVGLAERGASSAWRRIQSAGMARA
jgi:hypothetical protein